MGEAGAVRRAHWKRIEEETDPVTNFGVRPFVNWTVRLLTRSLIVTAIPISVFILMMTRNYNASGDNPSFQDVMRAVEALLSFFLATCYFQTCWKLVGLGSQTLTYLVVKHTRKLQRRLRNDPQIQIFQQGGRLDFPFNLNDMQQ